MSSRSPHRGGRCWRRIGGDCTYTTTHDSVDSFVTTETLCSVRSGCASWRRCCSPLVTGAAKAASTQPDIVIVTTDDMRTDDWRVLDDTQRLVGGTWFPNFIYTTPLSCPFRATL